jgi:predicted O-methyltransferase YrrM
MKKFLQSFWVFRAIYRFKVAYTYHFRRNLKNVRHWLIHSREHTNYTYHLTDLNRRYLIAFVAHITEQSYQSVEKYVLELENNLELKTYLQEQTRLQKDKWADIEPKFARRLAWYALVRIRKPKVVIETGVDKGLGSCILTAALLKNQEEGNSGYYYGTDINPKAGYLLQMPYSQVGEILYGDSIESLRKLDKEIDLFINDSDHSAEYEANEYQIIQSKLSNHAMILSDNAHDTDALLNFAQKAGRKFLFYKEQPARHWYSGAGIGVVF